MKFLRPVPASVSRPLGLAILLAWVLQMGALLRHSYFEASGVALAADLARYGTSAQWRGVYYRGEKIGFTVGQTVATAEGYELQEEGRIRMTLLGAPSEAQIKTTARVDRRFALKSFSFSLDPGTGPVVVDGSLDGRRLTFTVKTASGAPRTETKDLDEPPALSLSLSRTLAAAGLVAGKHVDVSVFDPATLRNATMSVDVKSREVVEAGGRPVPAFRLETRFAGVTSTSWVTDVGEVVREESPTGFLTVKETRERAMALAVPGQVRTDMLQMAAVVPSGAVIDEPTAVRLLRLRVDNVDLSGADLQGAGQRVSGSVFEIRNLQDAPPGPPDPEAASFLGPSPFLESDAPEIVAETRKALADRTRPREKAERLVRYVNAILEKKPTISLPSALEVLRTKVGDCNEHTALYVAMARAAGLPARIAVGLVYLHGAFYYHAWSEVYVEEAPGRALWLPVDPTLNQFPADATHVRVARGGLDKQTVILNLIGRLEMNILEVEVRPGSVPVLVGRPAGDSRPPDLALPHRGGNGPGCWSRPDR